MKAIDQDSAARLVTVCVITAVGLLILTLDSFPISASPRSQTFPTGTRPYAIGFDGTNIWVANYFSNNVTVRRASNGAFVATYSTGSDPAGITFDGTKMWIVNNCE